MPDPPHTITSDKISTVNESVPSLVPYVTAELSTDLANELKTFVIGDGMNYGLSSRKRRQAEEFAIRYDENRKQERREKRSDGPAKAKLFYNKPLEADSIYSAFQRTFIDKARIFKLEKLLTSHNQRLQISIENCHSPCIWRFSFI